MPFNDAQWDRLIEDAAKELYGVYVYISSQDIDQQWNELHASAKSAWRRVAEHVVQQNTELFGMLTTPDHK